MITAAAVISLVVVSLSVLLNLYRLFVGPDAPDRILALDTLVINAIAAIVMGGVLLESKLYFEAALLFAMVGFLTTVAYCKFILRGNIIE